MNTLNTKYRKKLTTADIGAVFWRVENSGSLQQYEILSVNEKGDGVHLISNLTNCNEYSFKVNKPDKKPKYKFTSEFGLKTIRKPEFYTNFNEAKKNAEKQFYEVINPHGKYVVNQHFDDVFEKTITKPMAKKQAQEKIKELNKSDRCYVSFRLQAVT